MTCAWPLALAACCKSARFRSCSARLPTWIACPQMETPPMRALVFWLQAACAALRERMAAPALMRDGPFDCNAEVRLERPLTACPTVAIEEGPSEAVGAGVPVVAGVVRLLKSTPPTVLPEKEPKPVPVKPAPPVEGSPVTEAVPT